MAHTDMTETEKQNEGYIAPEESRAESQEAAASDKIDMARFGSFVMEKRKEKGLTQKQLAEKLYLSNKAVSKWERGQSLPDIGLLEPLSRELGVTVTELLHGEAEKDGEHQGALTREEIQRLLTDAEAQRIFTNAQIQALMQIPAPLSREERDQLRGIKRKRALWYFIGLCLSVAEMTFLFVFRERLGFTLFDVSMGLLPVNPLLLFMGIWPFFFMPEKLPTVYDRVRISEYASGGFQMSVAGISFNNRNWPHIMKAMRSSLFLIPVCWPPAFMLLRWVTPDYIWMFGQIGLMLAVVLGGFFVPVAVMGKKYE